MESGIGRTGYIGLAFACFAIGALGLGITYLAFAEVSLLFAYLGLGLAGVGLLVLFLFTSLATWSPRPPSDKRRAGPSKVEPAAEQTPERSAKPEVEFEYKDAAPAARAAPEEMVLPQAFHASAPAPTPDAARDPTQWPERRGRSDWSARMQRESDVQAMVEHSPVRKEMAQRYTATTPLVRSIVTEPDAPLKVAERAPPDVKPGMAAPGMSVGRCGRCMTVLLAPDDRPLRLKCPECAKVTLLE